MNLPELITSLKTGGDEVFSTSKKLLIADALEALAAALAVKDEALDELKDLMEDVATGDYHPDSFTTQPAREALATKPHASLVNKIKADAVRGAKPEFVVALLLDHSEFAAIFGVLDHVADRIEKGEA